MFERFTKKSRRVLVLAQEEARLLGHPFLGSEHILLGLLHVEDGMAAKVLGDLGVGDLDEVRRQTIEAIGHPKAGVAPPADAEALAAIGIDIDEVRRRVEETFGAGALERTKRATWNAFKKGPPFTPRAKKVLEVSLREALSLRHDYIGTEHLLLGIVREDKCLAARILADLGATREAVRAAVLQRLPRAG